MPRPLRVSFAKRFAKNFAEHEAGLYASPVRHRISSIVGVPPTLRIRLRLIRIISAPEQLRRLDLLPAN